MNNQEPFLSVLRKRESYRDWYLLNKDPIFEERLSWQAQVFRHMVHLLPGETILEIGSGRGFFAKALAKMSKGRNPIVAGTFLPDALPGEGFTENVEGLVLDALPGVLEGRKFRYVVVQNILDRENATFLLKEIFDLLEDGGRVVFFESNPWNPLFLLKNAFRALWGRPAAQTLMSRPELYELISEIGFIRVSALFSDFVYRPFMPTLVRVFGALSVLLENMPLVRTLAGRILVQAQKPPRDVVRPRGSLVQHDCLHDAISVVVPCHNEAMNVMPLVDGLRGHFDAYLHQIVLVDDNSSDDTRAVIEKMAGSDSRITPVIRTPPNGVGYALKDGYRAATGRFVLSMDCDFQHLLPELEDMFDAAAEGYDAVFGSRFSRQSVLINYPFGKILANRVFHLLANLAFRFWRRDLTNNLKLMRSEIVRRLEIDEPWFAANAEIGLQTALSGYSLKEVPISWINRSFDMGQSTFRVLRSGGGYARVLARLMVETRFGFRPLRMDR
jgi:dolichol-phosphate mannosyltransferase